MRTILLLFAAGCLLTFASRGRGEFDSGAGMPTQAARTFGDSMAATRATRRARELTFEEKVTIILAQARKNRFTLNQVNRLRGPRTHRPANIPTRPYDEIIFSFTDDGFSIFVPVK